MSTLTLLSAGTQIGSEATSVAIPWVRIVLAFVFCILVAIGAIALLRVRQGTWDLGALRRRLSDGLPDTLIRARRLDLVEKLPMAPGHYAVLLRCDAAHVLLHLGPQGATVIADLPVQAAPAP